MKNIIKNVSIIVILLLIIFNRPLVVHNIINGMALWKNSIFPSIFPILIISDVILSSNIIYYITKLFGNLFSKLFNASKYSSYVFIMSLFSGCPANAKYTYDLLSNNIISNKCAMKILSMSMLYNPILIIGLTSYLKIEDSYFFIITNIFINIIIGLINSKIPCDSKNTMVFSVKFNIISSISNAIDTLLLILGTITLFITISAIIPINHPIISGILEITNGLSSLSLYDISYNSKMMITAILLSFGGLSIITQIKSIFKDTPLDYSLFYKSRIIHLILLLILTYFKTIFS